jgi:hypothetical protein
MLQLRQRLALTLKTLQVVKAFSRQNFKRDNPVHPELPRFVHHTYRPSAEHFENLEPLVNYSGGG